MRQVVDFLREPEGEVYHALLDAAIETCSLAMLVTRDADVATESARHAIDLLDPYLVSTEQASKWPGTKLLSGSATLRTYSYSVGVAEVLKRLTLRLYQWCAPELPEDLALFRGPGEVWLGSVAHERDAWLEPTNDELIRLVEVVPGIASLLLRTRRNGRDS